MAGLLVSQSTTAVNGSAVSVLAGSFEIQDAVQARSTATFTVRDLAANLSFAKGMPVLITDTLNTKTLFGGWVDKVSKQGFQKRGATFAVTLLHTLQCVDHHYLADKRVVIKKYLNMTAGAIVTDLVTNYLAAEGISIVGGAVETGPTIKEATFNAVTVAACMDALAEHAGFWWRIDGDKHLRFKAPTTETAPFTLSRTTMLAEGLNISQGNALYRNTEYITGVKDVTALQTELRQGDGTNRSWAMTFPLHTAPTVSVDNVAKTVGIRGTDTGKNFYWLKGEDAITQDDAGAVLVSPQLLQVAYIGEANFIMFSQDAAGVAARAAVETGTSGIVEVAEQAFDTQDASSAVDMAAQKLAKFNDIGSVLEASTRTTGLLPGQLATVTYPEWGITNIPMLIESVTTHDVGKEFRFGVRAFEGTPEGDWALAFARGLTNAGAGIDQLALGDATLLYPVLVPNETWTWTESITQTPLTCIYPGASVFPGAGSTLC